MNSGKAQTFLAFSQTSKMAELSNLNVKILHKGHHSISPKCADNITNQYSLVDYKGLSINKTI